MRVDDEGERGRDKRALTCVGSNVSLKEPRTREAFATELTLKRERERERASRVSDKCNGSGSGSYLTSLRVSSHVHTVSG